MSDTLRKQQVIAISLIGVVLLCASFLFLYHLGYQPLHNDEARYAEVITESFSSDHFLSLIYRNQPYFNKPPLLFWLVGIIHKFVPMMEVAVRLPSAISGILLVAAVMLLVFEVTKNKYAAALGGGILATTPSLVLLSRSGRFDTLITLFIVLATYCFLKALDDRRWFLLFGACIGLAIITKGPLVVFAIITALAIAWMYKRFDWIRDSYFWHGVGIAFLISLPWHVYETYLYGGEFWNYYLWQQIIVRVQQNIVSISLPVSNWDYTLYLFKFLAPWSTVFVLVLAILPFLWSRLTLKAKTILFVSIVEVASVILMCYVAESKAYRYLVPMYPFIAIVIAISIFEISRLHIPNIRRVLVIVCISLGAYAFAWTAYNGFLLNPTYPYSTDTPASAYDERQIAQILLSQHVHKFYVYNTANVDGIMYYSHIIDLYYFPQYGEYPGLDFVLAPQALSTFKDAYPGLKFSILYNGSAVLLAQEQ